MVRFFDIFFSLFAFFFFLPLFLIIIIILSLTGEREVFYTQKRIGKNGNFFDLYKFVTMKKNSANIGTGTITIKNDPRILPFGFFLRKTKINELPQLINVLKGDMSIVGPRPQTKRCFKVFKKNSKIVILSVRPGISGIGSIIFRNEEEIMDKSKDPNQFYNKVLMPYKGEVEEWFVKNNSIFLYFKIILVTLFVVIFPNKINPWIIFKGLPTPPNSLFKN